MDPYCNECGNDEMPLSLLPNGHTICSYCRDYRLMWQIPL